MHLNASRYRSYKRFTVDPTFCFIFNKCSKCTFLWCFKEIHPKLESPSSSSRFGARADGSKQQNDPPTRYQHFGSPIHPGAKHLNHLSPLKKGGGSPPSEKQKKNIASRPKSVLRGVWSLRGVTYFYVRKDLGKNKPRKRNSLRSLHVRTLLVFIRSAMHKS